ncbi:MAG: hypothetical protein M3Q33_11010 [Acidobacteriota bacterium]|nr:hypothetical protein [Acidobacteriota bacterium]
MKANNYISKKEYKLLLIFAFILFILAFTNFVCDSIESYNKRVQEEQIELKEKANNNGNSFGIYGDWGDNRPWYRFSFIFLTLLAFLTLRKTSIYISFVCYNCPFLDFRILVYQNIQFNCY